MERGVFVDKDRAEHGLKKFFDVMELSSAKSATVILIAVSVVLIISYTVAVVKNSKPEIITDYAYPVNAGDSDVNREAVPMKIFVHVKGEVSKPGLYEVEEGARVQEAIDAAGGFTDNAEVDSVNLAQRLMDEDEILVLSNLPDAKASEEAKPKSASKSTSGGVVRSSSSGSSAPIKAVNINTASVEELMTIPGIGESYARNIIQYRSENGAFNSIEEIMRIKGISKARFDEMKEYIRV